MVSGIYRLAPSGDHLTSEEARARVRQRLTALVATYGHGTVFAKLRDADINKVFWDTRSRLLRELWTIKDPKA